MNILFDLDGTLTDPKLGITNCIRFALKKLNEDVPEDLDWCIGPPLQDSFSELLKDKRQVDSAVDFYRERFKEVGMFENLLYDDIEECLKKVKNSGHHLFLATSKPIVYASEILKYFKLSTYFNSEYGSELDGTRKDKTDLIKYILDEESLNSMETIMVGDRKHDLIGAENNNVHKVGVSYGYGSIVELNACSPKFIANNPLDLSEYLLGFEKRNMK